MNIRFNLFHVQAIGLALILALAGGGVAQAQANSQTRAQELSNLQDAYNQMKIADKDYHGHRAKAMKAVKSAAKDLDGSAEAKHRGHESQSSSDQQMRQAATLLESVGSMASSMDQTELSKHVSKALAEIHTALALK